MRNKNKKVIFTKTNEVNLEKNLNNKMRLRKFEDLTNNTLEKFWNFNKDLEDASFEQILETHNDKYNEIFKSKDYVDWKYVALQLHLLNSDVKYKIFEKIIFEYFQKINYYFKKGFAVSFDDKLFIYPKIFDDKKFENIIPTTSVEKPSNRKIIKLQDMQINYIESNPNLTYAFQIIQENLTNFLLELLKLNYRIKIDNFFLLQSHNQYLTIISKRFAKEKVISVPNYLEENFKEKIQKEQDDKKTNLDLINNVFGSKNANEDNANEDKEEDVTFANLEQEDNSNYQKVNSEEQKEQEPIEASENDNNEQIQKATSEKIVKEESIEEKNDDQTQEVVLGEALEKPEASENNNNEQIQEVTSKKTIKKSIKEDNDKTKEVTLEKAPEENNNEQTQEIVLEEKTQETENNDKLKKKKKKSKWKFFRKG